MELEIKEPSNGVSKNTGHRNNQIIVFKIGSEEYGLAIDQIKEVVITPKITKVPLTPGYIKGVANIRGNILAIIDLEERFGMSASAVNNHNPDKPNYTLVIEGSNYKMGIIVKEVPNTLAIAEVDIDLSPNIIQDHSMDKSYIKGIVKFRDRLIILIDIYKIIQTEEISDTIKLSAT